VDLTEKADTARVRGDIDTALSSLDLPTGVIAPKLISPTVEGPDVAFSVAGEDTEAVYNTYKSIEQQLNELPDTASIEPLSPVERVLQVTPRTNDLFAKGVAYAAVVQQLSTLHEALPVGQVTIDEEQKSVLTSLGDVSLETIRSLEVRSATVDAPAVTLQDVADIRVDYRFVDNNVPYIGVRTPAGETRVLPAMVVYVKAADGISLGDYTDEVETLLAHVDGTQFVGVQSEADDISGTLIVEHFTNNEFNEQQVNEVVSGLVGGPLDTNSAFKHVGWVLGGIQLVFLVMLAFVSWRAALVAAAAIPLSLVFANMYLYFTGRDLNTLVLFSLVLVIGLVVDPALVILESIQRKIDTGLRGKAAALAAIDDVGMGLFLATLTNIIVFIPFAVISGFLGEIFSYIPLTVIPATIGSYIVPLIFLAWIGGMFLRPSKNKSHDEIANLWPVARWLIRFNERILRSSGWIRATIIVGSAAIFLAGKFFPSVFISSGHNEFIFYFS
jgi:HAE1 family hydrophobic/amphiphilic exporter-1